MNNFQDNGSLFSHYNGYSLPMPHNNVGYEWTVEVGCTRIHIEMHATFFLCRITSHSPEDFFSSDLVHFSLQRRQRNARRTVLCVTCRSSSNVIGQSSVSAFAFSFFQFVLLFLHLLRHTPLSRSLFGTNLSCQWFSVCCFRLTCT